MAGLPGPAGWIGIPSRSAKGEWMVPMGVKVSGFMGFIFAAKRAV
jgi:hypothetical protein